MPKTYEPIQSITLTGTASSIGFNSIPQTYTDLVLVGDLNTTASLDYWYRINNDTGTNFSITRVVSNGTNATSARLSDRTLLYFDVTGTTGQHNFVYHFMNYSNTTTFKTQLHRYNNAATETIMRVGLWRSTSAINTILIQTDASTFTSGSKFTLYGIKAA